MKTAPSSQRRRAGLIAFLVVSSLLAIGAIWSHQRLLGGVYETVVVSWVDRAQDAPPTPVRHAGAVRALIFYSTATARFTGNEAHQRALARQWQELLTTERVTAEIIADWPADHTRYDLLILPAVACMSDADMEWVKAFLRNGGGVIMSWATGVRDADGEWRAQSLLAHVGGITTGPSPALTGSPVHATMALSAQTPLTSGLPPGLPLQVKAYGEPLSGSVLEPRAQLSAHWLPMAGATPVRRGRPATHAPGAIVHGTYHRGRFVWLGFADLAAVTHPDYPQAITRIARNALHWVSRRPRASKPLWPQRADSAFSLSIAVRDVADLESPLWELVRLHRLPVTLFVTAEYGGTDPQWVDSLPHQVERGLLDDQPAKRAEPYVLRAETRRLRNKRRLVGAAFDDSTIRPGYRAADGQHTEELLNALVRAHFDYAVTRTTAAIHPQVVRSFRPVPLVTRARELWQLPEIPLRDLLSADQAAGTSLRSAFDAIHEAGGYFNLWVDGDQLDAAQLSQLDLFFYQLRQQNTWIAPVGAVYAFWRDWGHIDIATTHDAIGQTSLHISNSGLASVHDAAFHIDIDTEVEQMVLHPLTLGSPAIRATAVEPQRWEIHFGQIPPGKNFSYQLELR